MIQDIIKSENLKKNLNHPVIILIILIMSFIFFIKDIFFVVEPTELAGIRRLGRVVTKDPVEPGLHIKIPLIDLVDKLQVSMDTFKVQGLTVYTIDNQPVEISVGMTYRIPKTAVFKLLYEVGRAGDFDIANNIFPVMSDRIMKAFSKMNTTKISELREQIGREIKDMVKQSLNELFGIEVIDLQISGVKYSKTFETSVEAAVKAKNDAIAAENTVIRLGRFLSNFSQI